MVPWRLAVASWWRIVTGYQAGLSDGWLQGKGGGHKALSLKLYFNPLKQRRLI
jgi:hypothetical protein